MNDTDIEQTTSIALMAVIEMIIVSAIVILDFFIPTLVILPLAIISLLLRRRGVDALGIKQPSSWTHMSLVVLVSVVIWSLFHLALSMPILNRLTGTTQDLSVFEDLQGDIGALLTFLILTWTLAALGEEIVYRGYIQNRIADIFGDNRNGWIVAVLGNSILFGLAHTEQGIIGVIITFMDAIFFCFLYHHFDRNLWASILAHGMSNSIGLITFYFTGPIYGFW